jgi:hypothetical protein
MTYVVQFSTGAASAEVAWRLVERHGVDEVHLLTADTLVEDEDNWRFAKEVHAAIGEPAWTVLADGRTPMQAGRDARVVPNNRMAVCSRVLKRDLLREYIDLTYTAGRDIIALGYDWTEPERMERAAPNWVPWQVIAPLQDRPYVSKPDLLDLFRQRGIEPPRLYAQGFKNANCGGACVRGGHASWANLLRVNSERYADWERDEQETRDLLGKDVSILRDRSGGTLVPLTLTRFRQRLEQQPSLFDPDDWGACACTDTFGEPA